MSDEAPLESLHTAVQTFSNALADSEAEAGMVTAALVVWEELSYDSDGKPQYLAMYASTGDSGGRPAVALGLASFGLQRLKAVVAGDCECED